MSGRCNLVHNVSSRAQSHVVVISINLKINNQKSLKTLMYEM
jgi:hypothetical protein